MPHPEHVPWRVAERGYPQVAFRIRGRHFLGAFGNGPLERLVEALDEDVRTHSRLAGRRMVGPEVADDVPGSVLEGRILAMLALAIPLMMPAMGRALSRVVKREFAWPRPSPSAFAAYTAALVVPWLAYAMAFWLFGRALLGSSAPALEVAGGAFVASYVAGIVAVFAPAGIAVREAALVAIAADARRSQGSGALNPGMSGGPTVDLRGRVIGVNSQIASSSRQSSGVGFAVPVDTVKEVVPKLIGGDEIKRAYLGVSSGPDATEDGAVVMSITEGGPAADSGLRTGDRIIKVADRPITEPDELSAAVLEHKPGERIELTVVRGGDERTIDVQLGTRPDQLEQG